MSYAFNQHKLFYINRKYTYQEREREREKIKEREKERGSRETTNSYSESISYRNNHDAAVYMHNLALITAPMCTRR